MPLSTASEALLTDFEHQTGVTADQVTNLRSVINASPALVAQINSAVAAGHLQHFAALPANAHAGGSYDGGSKTMNLPLSILTAPSGGSINRGEVTFVLGHELQHGFNHAATTQAYTDFNHDVAVVAKSANAVHDYTPPTAALIAANRRDEAGAEIAGWNAIVSSVHAVDPHATLKDVYLAQPGRMQDFIDVDTSTTPRTYHVKPNLHLNADLTMDATAANVEGMGRNYFDKAPNDARLGHNGNSDYANYYGAYVVTVVAQNERAFATPVHGVAPHLTMDMARLHLSESLVEQNGIDLGSNHAPLPYYDSSTSPPTLHHFDHTTATHTHTPIEAAHAEPARPLDATDPAHPGNPLYRQIVGGVERLDAQLGRAPDESSRQVSAHLYAAARDAGLTQVTQVVANVETTELRPGQRLFAVQGAMDDPLRRMAWVDTAEALRTPAADALRRADVAQSAHTASVEAPAIATPERLAAITTGR